MFKQILINLLFLSYLWASPFVDTSSSSVCFSPLIREPLIFTLAGVRLDFKYRRGMPVKELLEQLNISYVLYNGLGPLRGDDVVPEGATLTAVVNNRTITIYGITPNHTNNPLAHIRCAVETNFRSTERPDGRLPYVAVPLPRMSRIVEEHRLSKNPPPELRAYDLDIEISVDLPFCREIARELRLIPGLRDLPDPKISCWGSCIGLADKALGNDNYCLCRCCFCCCLPGRITRYKIGDLTWYKTTVADEYLDTNPQSPRPPVNHLYVLRRKGQCVAILSAGPYGEWHALVQRAERYQPEPWVF